MLFCMFTNEDCVPLNFVHSVVQISELYLLLYSVEAVGSSAGSDVAFLACFV
jgi:hypothetical protein